MDQGIPVSHSINGKQLTEVELSEALVLDGRQRGLLLSSQDAEGVETGYTLVAILLAAKQRKLDKDSLGDLLRRLVTLEALEVGPFETKGLEHIRSFAETMVELTDAGYAMEIGVPGFETEELLREFHVFKAQRMVMASIDAAIAGAHEEWSSAAK